MQETKENIESENVQQRHCEKCGTNKKLVRQRNGEFICYDCLIMRKEEMPKRRRQVREEERIQSEFFRAVRTYFPHLPNKLVFAVPNDVSRNPIEAANLKWQGMVRGIVGVIVLIPANGCSCLCLEFKTDKGEGQFEDQKEFQKQAEEAGCKYLIVRSVNEAVAWIKEYLQLK